MLPNYKKPALWRFILPSMVGILCFLVPIRYQGSYAIPVAHLSNALYCYLHQYLPYVMVVFLIVSAVITLIGTAVNPHVGSKKKCESYTASPVWVLIRVLAAIIGVLVITQKGPSWVCHEATGMLMLGELLPKLFTNLLFASLLGPVLLDFGLLEYVGVLATSLMRPLFKLPGNAAVNCVASWVGDGTMGTVMALQQYEKKRYTARETAIVVTCFSAVSMTFYTTILSTLSLEDYFPSFCFTTIFSSLCAALILVRIPPITYIPASYINDTKQDIATKKTADSVNIWQRALQAALNKARKSPSLTTCLQQSTKNMLDIIISVLPGVMFIGCTSLVIGTYTTLLTIFGKPFAHLLRLLQVPEAQAASQSVLIGFTDMFMPVALAKSHLYNPMTKFIIGALSLTQIIYLSEFGPLLLNGKKFTISLSKLFWLFLLRTIITLPIIVLCAHYFVG